MHRKNLAYNKNQLYLNNPNNNKNTFEYINV